MSIRKIGRPAFFLVLVLVVSGLAYAAVTTRLQKDAKANTQRRADGATPVDKVVKTEKQKIHAKLYKEYSKDGRKSLRALASSAPAGEVGGDVMPGTPVLTPGPTAFDLNEFLKGAVRDADAVVVGSVKSKTSLFNEPETFIFTDYQLGIEEVLKNNPASPINLSDEITVTRPGGAVVLDNGRLVRVGDRNLRPLAVDGRYVIFLKYIPETGAYSAFNNRGAFRLLDGRFYKLTDEQLPKELSGGDNAAAFLGKVREAALAANLTTNGGAN
jgi:hypothetical protein